MKKLVYGSVCSGIEAATAAWHHLGWNPAFFSEIEPFPSAVLNHHYPNTPNYGDLTKYETWPIAPGSIDLLVGGTPCQSFSVAGLRKGLADPRGNLALVYLGLVDRIKPKWVVWENVPGVLSSGGGRDFGSFLGALGEIGYGFAYRVLDAQFFGVAQRRRRVFVVGYLGDWRPAAEVLFEQESLSGNPAPSRKAGERVAPTVTQGPPFSRTGNERVKCDAIVSHQRPMVFGADLSQKAEGIGFVAEQCPCIAPGTHPGHGSHVISFQTKQQGLDTAENICGTLCANDYKEPQAVALQPIAFQQTADCLTAAYSRNWNGNASATNDSLFVAQPIAVDCYNQTLNHTAQAISSAATDINHTGGVLVNISNSLTCSQQAAVCEASMVVRRLTPVECERLQGFPDNFTRIPWRNKSATECPDGPRYKALGNSMAVPVMRWIGERIHAYNNGSGVL